MLFTYLFWCYKLGFQQKLALPALQLSIFILFFHTQFQFKLKVLEKSKYNFFLPCPNLVLNNFSVFAPSLLSSSHYEQETL